MPTRLELQELAEKKLLAIKALFEKEFYDFVCHECGYVLEYGLKSAVCKYVRKTVYPENTRGYKTHNLNDLVSLSNLNSSLEKRKSESTEFFINWSIVSTWTVGFRYDPIGKNKKNTAEEYINAIESKKDGAFPWIKENW